MQKLSCTLLADDETTNYLNRTLLEKLAVTDELLIAQNGQQALDPVLRHCPAATPDCPVFILLDAKMPIMDGFEFLEAYAQLPLDQKNEAVVIVMLTTSVHPQDVDRVGRLNFAGYLNKPLNRDKVDGILQAHFQRRLPQN